MWLKIDPETGALAELHRDEIKLRAQHLLNAIEQKKHETPDIDFEPLVRYAEAGFNGQITCPQSWSGSGVPVGHEYREGLLPNRISNALSGYFFYTHGYLHGNEKTQQRSDGKYAWVIP